MSSQCAFIDVNADSVGGFLISGNARAGERSTRVGAGFETAAVIGVSSAFVHIHADFADSLKASSAFRETQRSNSIFVSQAWWVNFEGHASSLRSSAEFIVDDGAMRVITSSSLRLCGEPSALCRAVAIERRAGHSSWARKLVSSEVEMSHAIHSVGSFPFCFNL